MSHGFAERLHSLEKEVEVYKLMQLEQEKWKKIIENWVRLNFGYDVQSELRKTSSQEEHRFIHQQTTSLCHLESAGPKKIQRTSTNETTMESHATYSNMQLTAPPPILIPNCVGKDDPHHPHPHAHPMQLDFVAAPNGPNDGNYTVKIIGYGEGNSSVQEVSRTMAIESTSRIENPMLMPAGNSTELVATSGRSRTGPNKAKKTRKKVFKTQKGKGSGRGNHMKSASRKLLPRRKLKNLSIDEKYDVLQRLCQPGVNQATVCEERQLNKSVVSRIWCDRFKIEELYREGRGKHKKVKKQKDFADEGLPTLVPLPTLPPPSAAKASSLDSSVTPSSYHNLQQQFHTISRYNLLCLYTKQTFRELQKVDTHISRNFSNALSL